MHDTLDKSGTNDSRHRLTPLPTATVRSWCPFFYFIQGHRHDITHSLGVTPRSTLIVPFRHVSWLMRPRTM